MTYRLVESEEEELLEVVIADAVPQPRAVMIHLQHACFADGAVMCALRLPIPANHAVVVLVRWHHLWDRLRTAQTPDQVARVVECHDYVENQGHDLLVHLILHPVVHLLFKVKLSKNLLRLLRGIFPKLRAADPRLFMGPVTYIIHEVDGEEIEHDDDGAHTPDEDIQLLVVAHVPLE